MVKYSNSLAIFSVVRSFLDPFILSYFVVLQVYAKIFSLFFKSSIPSPIYTQYPLVFFDMTLKINLVGSSISLRLIIFEMFSATWLSPALIDSADGK